ncbi:hypothetical protein [Desulfatirhabdium butyrativorans]|uniref:hypothetical protein n=1 Tax=Desulfatirhabdium butyrativorans TaxID=340467 RepID=UPI0004071AC3|nr:hypothetical protein [Desulfatirhabdium butyrativorans]
MVLTISEDDWMKMKETLLDRDSEAALEIVREFVKRLEIQAGQRMKSHLDGH